MSHLVLSFHGMLAAVGVPDPGSGSAPPGSAKLLDILKWVLWGAAAVCVGGVIVAGAKMGFSHRRGDGGEHAQGLAMVLSAA